MHQPTPPTEPSLAPPPSIDSALALEEYRALRATIRERGTARMLVVVITFVAWAALTVALEFGVHQPAAALPGLVVLVAGFEVVLALHLGVERIGRYVQVTFEAPAGPGGWEHTAMALGRLPGTSLGIDALFALPFLLALAANLALPGLASFSLAALMTPVSACLAAAHLAVAVRIIRARAFAAGQRARDLAFLEQMRRQHP